MVPRLNHRYGDVSPKWAIAQVTGPSNHVSSFARRAVKGDGAAWASLKAIVKCRRMRRSLSLAILLMFCSGITVPAQDTPRPKHKISAADILDENVAATGGPEARHALQEVDAQGSFGVPGLHSSGDFHFYYRAPASDVFELEMISHGRAWVGHDEGTPFVNHTVQGPSGINGVSANILEQNWLALTESGLDQRYTRIELAGLTEIDGNRAFELRFTPKVGDPQIRYYDCKSFLLVRMDLGQRIRMQKDGPEFAYKVETYYSEYRDSGGIKFPHQIRAISPEGNVVLDVHEIHTNRPVNEALFRKK